MEENLGELRSCTDCKAPCAGEFKKVAGLQNSRLLIYVHKTKESSVQKGLTRRKKDETFILHNTSEKNLKRPDYIKELCQYRTKCFQCKSIIQRVRSLLDEITEIKKNQVLGVCEHCKHANPAGKCRRCEYIVRKFLCDKEKQSEDKQNRFKSWLCKVNQLLQGILECENVCRHKLYKESISTVELEKLLQELKSPLTMHQPDICLFPDTDAGKFISLESLTANKEMIEELIIKLKSESLNRRSSDSLFASRSRTETSCVCKYFMDKKFQARRSMEVLPQVTEGIQKTPSKAEPEEKSPAKQIEKFMLKVSKEKIPQKESVPSIEETPKNKLVEKENIPPFEKTPIKKPVQKDNIPPFEKSPIQKPVEKENIPPFEKTPKKKTMGKENIPPIEKTSKEKPVKENIPPTEKTPKENPVKEVKPRKPKRSPEEDILYQIAKAKSREKKEKLKEKSKKLEKIKDMKFDPLPQLKQRHEKIDVIDVTSESFIECDPPAKEDVRMVKGTRVVPLDPHYKDEVPCMVPLLYQVEAVFSEPKLNSPSVSTTNTSTTASGKGKRTKELEEFSRKGVISYELSNPEFIEKGWTILPTTKVMRKMNIYKMKPSYPETNWFARNKDRTYMFYDSGEKLAELNNNGCGKWYYRNGRVALDYYNAAELNAGQRYVVYSSGVEEDCGKKKPDTVLASFDYLGNGVVYDHYGNERLKYNQSEGLVIDEKIAPPGRWKWHALNEPPVLQPVYADCHLKERCLCLEERDYPELESKHDREQNPEMVAIEFENFAKEKANKLLQKFKPFQIRMKAVKINDQFSLRIMDQANIYILFRDFPISLKVNLGMILISSEIVDTETAEVSQVATPYDRYPPKSNSVADIQNTLKNARRVGKMRAVKSQNLTKKSSGTRTSNNTG